jgi:Tfp pilus assembly protein PilN
VIEQQINLYQPILRAEKRLFSAAAIGAGLLLLVVALAALAGYAAWQVRRAEAAVAELDRQEASALGMAQRAAAGAPSDAAALQAELVRLSDAIAARERALAALGRRDVAPGFAASLEALAKPAIDGLWLRRIVVDPSRGGLALQGATRDPRLVPQYLEALRDDRALAGAAFGDFELRRAGADDAPAAAVFVAAAPGLAGALARDPYAARAAADAGVTR